MDRVNAQQARRILDRLVGYKISPLLWSKVRSGLSAGRVQSIAVKLIVDREREILAFVAREYWTITARLSKEAHELKFPADLVSVDGEKAEISEGDTAGRITAELERGSFSVKSVKRREQKRNPAAPFTTSTIQQEASRKLRLRVRRTMQLAQALYEGVDLGSDGTQGLITYMRTDSTRIADSARDAAKDYIVARFGEPYYAGIRTHKLREGAQDAHEAIRPTDIERTPEKMAAFLKRDELRLYTLIWERFVASQMASAVYDQTTNDIVCTVGEHVYGLRATGSVMKFPGFTAVYEEGLDDQRIDPEKKGKKERIPLPALDENELLERHGIEPKQHFTEPPPRFTEATLVRSLEEHGVGRPSTYSSIVETIQARQYVEQTDRRFFPTEIGISVNDLLAEHFQDIMNLEFTASMESQLDRVAEGNEEWADVLSRFYGPFATELALAEEKIPKLETKDELTDEICPNCGKGMVIKTGRFGRFVSCTGYPECKTTHPIFKETGVACPKDDGRVVERRSKKGRTFYGCANYPACDFVSWDPIAKEPCPTCGAYVTVKSKRGTTVFTCSASKEHDVSSLGGNANAEDAEPADD